MVMKLTPNLEETTVQGIDMKCFLINNNNNNNNNKLFIRTYQYGLIEHISYKS